MNAKLKIKPDYRDFAPLLLDWYKAHGRKSLPWQNTRDPYPVWLSEIMLQQTQVDTVIPYFQRFLAAYPDIESLAAAHQDQVLALWAGLGYYARARNLHKAAAIIVQQHDGVFPDDFNQVLALPGIGRSTAGAILAFSKNQRHPILDGNVKRVLTRIFGIGGYPGARDVQEKLWALADELTPGTSVAQYTQAIMDLGATLCTRSRPRCLDCPFAPDCVALNSDSIADFPGKKPRRQRPTRATAMLVILNTENEVLLEQRPATGIWGGLYSLPEAKPDIDDLAGFCRTHYDLSVGPPIPLRQIKHGFTHFDLLVTPLMVKSNTESTMIADGPGLKWVNPRELQDVGIPAAVKRILTNLADTQ